MYISWSRFSHKAVLESRFFAKLRESQSPDFVVCACKCLSIAFAIKVVILQLKKLKCLGMAKKNTSLTFSASLAKTIHHL